MVDYKGYRGNQSLKRPGEQIEWTPEQMLELAKCSEDIIYFAENYFKIVTGRGFELIKLRDYQKEMLWSMVNNQFTISNQSRQSGKSECFRIFLTWYILFNEYKTVAILANKGDTAREILGKLQLSYQALPIWLQRGIKDFNKGSFELENGSRIIATSTSKNSARGFTAHVIVIDEMAFIENWEEFYAAVYPVISSITDDNGQMVGKLIITSTPNGLNHFYEFWTLANEKDPEKWNGFHPIFVPWDKVPGRDDSWRQKTLKALNFNQQKFDAEFGCEFLGSSGTLIAGWKLKQLLNSYQKPLKIQTDLENLKMYEQPIKGKTEKVEIQFARFQEVEIEPQHNYVLVGDVSRGKGQDYHAFSVLDVSTLPYKQVCIFRDNEISVADYADIVYKTAVIYNNAYVLMEINDIGEQVEYILTTEYEYQFALYTENSGKSGKKISFGGKKADRGIRTTKTVKSLGCSFLKLLVEQNKLLILDQETITELTTFSLGKKGSYEAEAGKHDDMVMGLVLFSWLTDQAFFKNLTSIDTITQLRETSEQQIREAMTPFGFVVSTSSAPNAFGSPFETFNLGVPYTDPVYHPGYWQDYDMSRFYKF